MLAYEFYLKDENGNTQLVGILPERRKAAERINQRSIFNWVTNILGDDTDPQRIFFIKVILSEGSGEIVESPPSFGAQRNQEMN